MNYGFTPDPGEEVIRVIHRSPVTLVPAFGAALILVVLAVALSFIAGRFPTAIPHAGSLMGLIAAIFIILSVIAVLVAWYVYRRNLFIFTNFHLIQVEQTGLFNHQVSQLAFARVQDVSGSTVGVWQTLFNFGDVIVQSAGEQEKFVFKGATSPARVADDALQTRDRCMHEAQAKGGLGAQAPIPPPDPAQAPAQQPDEEE